MGTVVQVPETVAMMRQESSSFNEEQNQRSKSQTSKTKSVWDYVRSKSSSQSGSDGLHRARVFKQAIPQSKMVPKDSRVKKKESRLSKAEQEKVDIVKKQKLWRAFRRNMNAERQRAIQNERRQVQENDAVLQLLEQENEMTRNSVVSSEPFVIVDSCKEQSQYEVVLPGMLTSSDRACSVDGQSIDSGFWDFLNIFNGTPWKGDSDTASTSDVTSLASETTMESERSWQTWNSTETTKVNNCEDTRELIMRHFGGENDSPWLAAKRGDLIALELRWKNRHDWTLEDEHGNTPLYYACRYGGAQNLRAVFFLLQQWPKSKHIPEYLMHRCKADAANPHVQELLLNPSQAEWLIHDFEVNCYQEERYADEEDDDEDGVGVDLMSRLFRENLYGIYEADNEEEED